MVRMESADETTEGRGDHQSTPTTAHRSVLRQVPQSMHLASLSNGYKHRTQLQGWTRGLDNPRDHRDEVMVVHQDQLRQPLTLTGRTGSKHHP